MRADGCSVIFASMAHSLQSSASLSCYDYYYTVKPADDNAALFVSARHAAAFTDS